MYEFIYHRAETQEDVQPLLEASQDGKIMAGGMTLLPAMKLRLTAPANLIDLAGLDDLKGLKKINGFILSGIVS